MRREITELVRLAFPLTVSFAGTALLGFVDAAMVGRLGSAALGAVGLGNAIFMALIILGVGLVSGTDPLIAQAVGAGEPREARRILWQGLRVGLWVSGPIIALMLAIAFSLPLLGIDPDTAAATRAFLLGRALNVPPALIAAALRSYLQASGRTRPIVVAMIVANVANFLFDVVLIFGDGGLHAAHLRGVGLPALGVFGAGLSSALASFLSVAVVALAVRRIAVDRPDGVRVLDPALIRKTLRVGTPIGLHLLAEVGAFSIAALLAGTMGGVVVAGHYVALSLATLTFTTAQGVGTATTVRVGQAIGRGDTPGARRAGFQGLWLGCAQMSACALVFFFAPRACGSILTDNADVLAAAVPLIRIAALFQISDAAQGVLGAALRGAGDTRFTQVANLIGHFALGLPIAFALGFYTPLGARGIWWGLSVGLSVVAVLLFVRFERLSRRPLARA